VSGNDLVRVWKDPDERGAIAHPAGEITLDDLSGGLVVFPPAGSFWWQCPSPSFCGVWCPDPPIIVEF
jgi:hypothetical protein